MVKIAPPLNEVQKRIISIIILFPLTIYMLLLGDPYSNWFIAVFFFLSLAEWMKMTLKTNFSLHQKIAYFILGFIYICAGFGGFWHINYKLQIGVLLLVTINDVASYVIGKGIGGAKLAPSISPKKTWAGCIGGFSVTMIVCCLILWHYYDLPMTIVGLIAFLIIVAQLGDLLESWVKRKYDVKDSSNLIPGHGGVLDRLDSLIAVGIIMLLYHLQIMNINGFVF